MWLSPSQWKMKESYVSGLLCKELSNPVLCTSTLFWLNADEHNNLEAIWWRWQSPKVEESGSLNYCLKKTHSQLWKPTLNWMCVGNKCHLSLHISGSACRIDWPCNVVSVGCRLWRDMVNRVTIRRSVARGVKVQWCVVFGGTWSFSFVILSCKVLPPGIRYVFGK